MQTLLLGALSFPSKYKNYITYLQKLQGEGKVYEKAIVDDLINRFIEIANDNYHIKEAHRRKKEDVIALEDRVSEIIASMQGNDFQGMSPKEEKEVLDYTISAKTNQLINNNSNNNNEENKIIAKPEDNHISLEKDNPTSLEVHQKNTKTTPSIALQLLQIKEGFSALTAHTLSILLVIIEIEDLLKKEF